MTQPKISLGQAIDQIIAALEGLDSDARGTALETARAHLKIAGAPVPPIAALDIKTHQPSAGGTQHQRHDAAAPSASSARDIRSLRTEKNPKSAREMACVVAFYLQEVAPAGERKESISTADLEK